MPDLLTRLTQAAFDFLNAAEEPRLSEVIFVFAGRTVRKDFGIELWKRALAPELILSVGRFEWRGYYGLGLASDGGLRILVDGTPAARRHFFVRVTSSQISSVLVAKGYLGTQSEARGLARTLAGACPRSILVVSTSFHLRRALLVLRRAFGSKGPQIFGTAVPEHAADVRRAELATSGSARMAVLKEFAKYLMYVVVAR